MKLWTIQPIEVIEILENHEEFVCDISKSEFYNENAFMKGYEWMASMMDAHGISRPDREVGGQYGHGIHGTGNKKSRTLCSGFGN